MDDQEKIQFGIDTFTSSSFSSNYQAYISH